MTFKPVRYAIDAERIFMDLDLTAFQAAVDHLRHWATISRGSNSSCT